MDSPIHLSVAKPPGWRDLALCAEISGDLFFPDKGEPSAPAKAVCRRCEVAAQCLEYALDRDERFGVWGGMSERERRRLKQQRATELPQPARRAA